MILRKAHTSKYADSSGISMASASCLVSAIRDSIPLMLSISSFRLHSASCGSVASARLQLTSCSSSTKAIKFTPQHGAVTVTAEHQAADAETGEECYVFQVADNGVGMSEDALEKLLRSLQTGTREAMEEGGTVYGLSIVKSLLERMGGSILLASKQGEGTIFTVKIPSRKAGK